MGRYDPGRSSGGGTSNVVILQNINFQWRSAVAPGATAFSDTTYMLAAGAKLTDLFLTQWWNTALFNSGTIYGPQIFLSSAGTPATLQAVFQNLSGSIPVNPTGNYTILWAQT